MAVSLSTAWTSGHILFVGPHHIVGGVGGRCYATRPIGSASDPPNGRRRAGSASTMTRSTHDYLPAMRDPNSAGPAKGLVRALQDTGIDLSDKLAVNAWIMAFNAMPIAERDRILGRLPGDRSP